MSIAFHYQPETPIRTQKLFNARLKDFNLKELIDHPRATKKDRLITDGINIIRAHCPKAGNIHSLSLVTTIFPAYLGLLDAIVLATGTSMIRYTENEPEYWGFHSWREMLSLMEIFNREHRVDGDPEWAIRGDDAEISKSDVEKKIYEDSLLARPGERHELPVPKKKSGRSH